MANNFKYRSFFSAVLKTSGLLKLGVFFIVHRNSNMSMTASLSLVSRKKKATVKQSAKMSDETSGKMTKP